MKSLHLAWMGAFLSLTALASETDCKPYLLTAANSGISPQAYFENQRIENQPRFVLTVGIPGSGKSTWVKTALRQGWLTVSPDDIRTEILTDMQVQGRQVTLKSGQIEPADPKNPNHYFNAPSIRTEAYALAHRRIDQGLREGKSIVWDTINVDAKRIPLIYNARLHGYQVEALVFQTPNTEINARNIQRRALQGGLDLVPPGTPNGDQTRLGILNSLNSLLTIFDPARNPRNAPAHLGPYPTKANPELFPRGGTSRDMEDYLRQFPAEQQDLMRKLLEFDTFDRVETVSVLDFEKETKP